MLAQNDALRKTEQSRDFGQNPDGHGSGIGKSHPLVRRRTILPSRPTRSPSRRAQRLSRTARLRAAASAAHSVLDSREHDGSLDRVGTAPIKKRERSPIKRRAPAHKKLLVHEEDSGAPISVSKVQARFHDLVVPHQINLTSGRRAKRLHQYPACGGRGSGGTRPF